MVVLILLVLIIGSSLGIFLGLLVSMLFSLGLFLFSDSPAWRRSVLTGKAALVLRSGLAAALAYKLAFHGVYALVAQSAPAFAVNIALCFAVWAGLVAFFVGVNMLRLIPIFVYRKTAN